jgi:hypothetical protein
MRSLVPALRQGRGANLASKPGSEHGFAKIGTRPDLVRMLKRHPKSAIWPTLENIIFKVARPAAATGTVV